MCEVRVQDGLPNNVDGLANAEDGPIKPWDTFARRQQQRGESVLIDRVLGRDVAYVAYPPFLPPPWVGDERAAAPTNTRFVTFVVARNTPDQGTT